MHNRILLLISIFISFFSCNKTEDPISPNPVGEEQKEDPVVVDETDPELTVIGFEDIIETSTEVSITVVDESTVETKVMYDGAELATSTEKQFDVSVNPYQIPVGATEFTVISTDANGNETSELFAVEIKHLLMTYGYTAREQEVGFERWLFFNDLEGKELEVVQPEIGDLKIYTDEIILESHVFFSTANYIDQGGTFKSLFLHTYKVPLGKIKQALQTATNQPSTNMVDVRLNDVFHETGWPQYLAQGSNYFTNSYDGDDTFTNLTISHDGMRPIYITPYAYARNPVFDGKKENYRYAKFTPELGNTALTIELESLLQAEGNLRIDLPAHDDGTLLVSRNGFENDQDWEAGIFHRVFEMTGPADYIDLPLLSDFQLYNTSITYVKNGKRYSTFGNDDGLILEMPDWQVDIQIGDSVIEVSSNDQEVDKYLLAFNKRETSTDFGTTSSMAWRYHFSVEDNETQASIPRLTLPTVLSDYLNTPFYQNTDDLVWSNYIAYDYEAYASYDEVIASDVFGENNATYANINSRFLVTYNPNYTGKSADQFSKRSNSRGLKEFHNRGNNFDRVGDY